jgi:hypothetical protein
MAEMSQDQIDQIRQALGIGREVPDSDIEALHSSAAGRAALQKIQGQGQADTGIPGFFSRGWQNLVTNYPNAPGYLIGEMLKSSGVGAKAKSAKTSGGGGAGGANNTSANQAIQSLYDYLEQSQLAQTETAIAGQGSALAQQNQDVTNLVDQQMQAAGAASGNPAVSAAMNAYTTAYNTGEGINSAAYQNMGVANAQYVASAPEQPLANLLAQNFGGTYYKQLPANLVNAQSPEVKDALKAMGVTEVGGGAINAGNAGGFTSAQAAAIAKLLNTTGAANSANNSSGGTLGAGNAAAASS